MGTTSNDTRKTAAAKRARHEIASLMDWYDMQIEDNERPVTQDVVHKLEHARDAMLDALGELSGLGAANLRELLDELYQ